MTATNHSPGTEECEVVNILIPRIRAIAGRLSDQAALMNALADEFSEVDLADIPAPYSVAVAARVQGLMSGLANLGLGGIVSSAALADVYLATQPSDPEDSEQVVAWTPGVGDDVEDKRTGSVANVTAVSDRPTVFLRFKNSGVTAVLPLAAFRRNYRSTPDPLGPMVQAGQDAGMYGVDPTPPTRTGTPDPQVDPHPDPRRDALRAARKQTTDTEETQ